MKTLFILVVGGLIGGLIVWVTTPSTLKESWDKGYVEGKKEALRINPPSDQLEMTCAGLWFSKENEKYWRKREKSN